MILDIVGWVGSVLVVLAYTLNMYKKMAADGLPYYLFNVVGSGCLIANNFYHHAIPAAVVNAVWILIAVSAMFKRKLKSSSAR
jgi:hypothetical protein